MEIEIDYNPYPSKSFFISLLLSKKEALSFDYTTKAHRVMIQVLAQKKTFPRHVKPTSEWDAIVFKNKQLIKRYHVRWIDQGKRDWVNNELWETVWQKPISERLTAKLLRYSQLISGNYRSIKKLDIGKFERFLKTEMEKIIPVFEDEIYEKAAQKALRFEKGDSIRKHSVVTYHK